MLNIIKRWGEPVGAIASVFIAVFAFYIQRDLEENASRRAAVERSLAIYRDFTSDKQIMTLSKIVESIDREMRTQGKIYKSYIETTENDKNYTYNKILAYVGRKFTDKTKNHISEKDALTPEEYQFAISTLMRHAKVIHDCGSFSDIINHNKESMWHGESKWPIFGTQSIKNKLISENGTKLISDNGTCDRKTLFTLLGSFYLDIFFILRPLLYCDDYVRRKYFWDNEQFVSEGEKLETVALEFSRLDRDVIRRDQPVFRKRENLESEEPKLTPEQYKDAVVVRINHDKACPFTVPIPNSYSNSGR